MFRAFDEATYSLADVAITPLVLMVLWFLHRLFRRAFDSDADAAREFDAGFALHVVSSLAMALVYWPYYGADMSDYRRFSVPLAESLRVDFMQFAPQFVVGFFQGEPLLPSELMGAGSTASMNIVVATCFFVLFDSMVASCLFLGGLAYLSKVLAYRALEPELSATHRVVLRRALLFLPTGVIWSTVILKESVAIIGVGLLIFGLRRVVDGRWLTGPVFVAPGAVMVGMLKPHLLLAVVLAAGVWLARKRVLTNAVSLAARPVYLVVGFVVVLAGLVGVGRFFPSLAVDQVLTKSAQQRALSSREEGGSNFVVNEGEAVDEIAEGKADVSLSSQLQVLPLALVATFFRPFLFEVRNPMQLMNSLETTALLYMALRAARGWRRMVRFVFSSPTSMFATVLVLVQAVGVGLSTANLGTLSRYRAPMMPYAAFLLACAYLDERAEEDPGGTTENVGV